MILAFGAWPAASGRGLCYIDRVYFRVSQSRVKKWEVLARHTIWGFPIEL